MSDIIVGVITSVEDDWYNEKQHKKVTLGTGQVLNVKYGKGGKLKAKWDLLQGGVAIKFTMGEYNGKPFVADIEAVETPPAKEPEPLLKERQGIIDNAIKEENLPRDEFVAEGLTKFTQEPIDKIETAMWYKEIGKAWRRGLLKDDEPIHQDLKTKYFNRMFKAVGISAKL